MADTPSFAKLVPGFDFLQGLMKGAGAGLPAMNQWIAPTLDPDELDKRIKDLRTVQFWLEQNAKMIGTTVQALEVQRMTLATLKTMNMPMADVSKSLAIPSPSPSPKPSAAPEPAPRPATRRKSAAKSSGGSAGSPAVDPMQWWGALTQQFTELAAQAIKDVPAAAAHAMATPSAEPTATPAPAARKRAAPRRSTRSR